MSGSARGDEAMPRRLLYRLNKDAAIAAAFFVTSIYANAQLGQFCPFQEECCWIQFIHIFCDRAYRFQILLNPDAA